MATNAQHQAIYRARQVSAGRVRLDTHISADAHAALTTLAQREGASVRAVVETAILNQHKGAAMQNQWRTDDPATDPVSKPRTVKPVSQPATRKDLAPMTTTNPAPARPNQMTAAEALELERFKQSLPNAIVGAELDQKARDFNGGNEGARRKAAFEAQLNASNIHRT